MNLQPLFLFLHVTAVVVWIGGMFFAYVCLRPAAAQLLEPALRLRLWAQVLARFFVFVWGAVALILVSGMAMIAAVGFAAAPRPWHLMMGLGLLMAGIFAYVFFVPFGALKRGVAAEDWKAGAAALARIRHLVAVNLVLGAVTLCIATLGRMAL
jgi:uncharacterized membrane protein